jgi:hypothetical protein
MRVARGHVNFLRPATILIRGRRGICLPSLRLLLRWHNLLLGINACLLSILFTQFRRVRCCTVNLELLVVNVSTYLLQAMLMYALIIVDLSW